MPFISFYDYITSREITQEKNEKIDKKIKHFECLHQFFYFKSVKLPSFALAILDDYNNGIVLNGIYARDSSNIYAKPVENGESKYVLSNEEKEAINRAINNIKQ